MTNYCDWNATEGSIKGIDIEEALLAIAQNPAFLSCTDTEFMEGVAGRNGCGRRQRRVECIGDQKGMGQRLRGSEASDLHLRGTADPDGLFHGL